MWASHVRGTTMLLGTTLLFMLSSCNRKPGTEPTSPHTSTTDAGSLRAEEARAIAKEAYTYGFPIVDSYRILYSYFVDRSSPEYKAAWNEKVFNNARVFTPEDRAMQTPNSDTPYSHLGLDLRAEPMVLTMPAVEKGRYYSAEVNDLYTFIAGYIGSRTTGNEAGHFLIAGPRWNAATPEGIKGVIRSETELAFVFYRTQLFRPEDIDNVKKVQAGYKVQPLSAFLGTAAPTPAPKIAFMEPISAEEERTSLEFFNVLNWVLQFCPTHRSEEALIRRFAKLGIGAGKEFNADGLVPEIRKAIEDGRADAWREMDRLSERIAAGEVTSGDVLGTRASLQNNYLYRMRGTVAGIWGNIKEEAIYPAYYVDSTGQPLNGATNRYTVRFAADQLPPVNAFWSLTMYDLPDRLLVANPINRYLINSAMLPKLKRDADGGLRLYLQHESPGKQKEANWLPAPSGPFLVALRLYWPKPEALDGRWKQPPMQRVDR
jgi:hypothetical protein